MRDTNYEPNVNIENKAALIKAITANDFDRVKEIEDGLEVEVAKETSPIVSFYEKELEAYEQDTHRKALALTRQQRRKLVRDTEIKYAKQRKNFGRWAEKLDVEILDLFKQSFEAFLNYPLPKKDMDMIFRGLNDYNFRNQKWSEWQLKVLVKNYDRKVARMLDIQEEAQAKSQQLA